MKLINVFESSISEAALGIDGLALLNVENLFYCIYEPTEGLKRALLSGQSELGASNIKGAINVRPNSEYGSFEVYSVYADKGYGPLMYKIAMSYAGNSGLMPTRSKNITPEAKRIWKEFYNGVGASDVKRQKIDEAYPEEFLNYKYVINKPVNLSTATALNNRFLMNDKHGELRDGLLELADSLLLNKMRSIYNPKKL